MAAADLRPLNLVACASLVFLERGAVLFGAFAVARGLLPNAIALTIVSGLIFLLRSALLSARVRSFEARARDELLAAVFGARDTPGAADVRTALIRGVDAQATLRGRLLPSLLGDAAAGALVSALVLHELHGPSMVAFAAGVATASVVALAARRVARVLARGVTDLHEAAFRVAFEGLNGREDLVASGRGEAFRARVRARTNAWMRVQARASAAQVLLGRGPALVAVAAGIGVYGVLRPPSTLVELAPATAILLPLGGLLVAAAEWLQLETRTAELRALIDAPRAAGGTQRPAGMLPLALEAVTVRFDRTLAVDGVSLRCTAPSLLVLAGPNGSGKSTLLRALVGIAPVASGAIRFGDRELSELDVAALRRRVSYLPQRPHLPAMATVYDALTFLDEASRDDAIAALERVEVLSALRTHEADDPLSVSVDDLSGGERQRVALARALLRKDAELHLFDEPDANLDRRGIERVVGILRELAKRSVVIVAAHTEEVIAAADVVVRLDAGRVVTPPAPADSPRSPAASTKAAS